MDVPNSAALLGMLHSEENGNVLHRNVANYLQVDTAQNPPSKKILHQYRYENIIQCKVCIF